MKHIMVDIETFSNKSYAMIIALGAVWFDPNEQGKIKGEFYVTVDPAASEKAGFRMQADTLCWWLHPDQRAAWDAFMSTAHFEPMEAFSGFSMWLDEIDTIEPPLPDEPAINQRAIWGNGAGYDNVLLRQTYEVLNLEVPWPHFNDRCFRTFKNLPRAAGVAPPIEGVLKHHALEDARQQAKWLQNIIKEYDLKI